MIIQIISFGISRIQQIYYFFLYELVENLILGKNQEKKSRKIRGSRDIPVGREHCFRKIFFAFL